MSPPASSPPPHARALIVSTPTAALHNLLRIACPPVPLVTRPTSLDSTVTRPPGRRPGRLGLPVEQRQAAMHTAHQRQAGAIPGAAAPHATQNFHPASMGSLHATHGTVV